MYYGKCSVKECNNGRIRWRKHCIEHNTVNLSGAGIEVTKSKPRTGLLVTSTDFLDSNRGTGRTKRMLLKAALTLSENNKGDIVIIAYSVSYAISLKKDLLSILSCTFGKEYTETLIRRIKTYSSKGYDNTHRHPNWIQMFTDHYQGEQ